MILSHAVLMSWLIMGPFLYNVILHHFGQGENALKPADHGKSAAARPWGATLIACWRSTQIIVPP